LSNEGLRTMQEVSHSVGCACCGMPFSRAHQSAAEVHLIMSVRANS
jgi:hypothetical protein